MKKLIFENLDRIQEYSLCINDGMTNCNELAQEFNKLGLKKIESPAQVISMVNDVETFAASMLPDDQPKQLFGIQLKGKRLMDLLELDFSDLKKMIKTVKQTTFAERNIGLFADVSKVTKGIFEVDPAKLAVKLEGFKTYAMTDKELAVLSAYQQMIEGFTAMAEVIGFHRLTEKSTRELFELRGQKFSINPVFWNQSTR